MTTKNNTIATLLIAAAISAFVGYSYMTSAYDCATDIECEIEEAKRCWILCEA